MRDQDHVQLGLDQCLGVTRAGTNVVDTLPHLVKWVGARPPASLKQSCKLGRWNTKHLRGHVPQRAAMEISSLPV